MAVAGQGHDMARTRQGQESIRQGQSSGMAGAGQRLGMGRTGQDRVGRAGQGQCRAEKGRTECVRVRAWTRQG